MQPNELEALIGEDFKSYMGPYDGVLNGMCADGHPLSGVGRCEPLNLEDIAKIQLAKASGSLT